MNKKKKSPPLIESITHLFSEENGMTIQVIREEQDKDFDHTLNVKVMKEIITAEHKTTYHLLESLLALHRVYQVRVINKSGNGLQLTKNED